MYIRTTRRKNADGSVVSYYQLAENVWDAERGCAVAKVIYSFGRADEIDHAKLQRLARSILRVFGGEEQLASSPDVRVLDAWPYGGIYVLEALWRELGLDAVLTTALAEAKIQQPFERALFAMVANRALCPYSKHYAWEQWLRQEVYLPGADQLALHHLYRAMDFLQDRKAAIEKSVYFTMANLMNADVDLIFYDTTSLHFEIDEEDEAPVVRGARTYEPPRKRGPDLPSGRRGRRNRARWRAVRRGRR